jgi:hypothetical protein
LEHARPVTARNGWLVLEPQRERRADGLKLCVCNPMTGDMALLPPLDYPGSYACTLLTGHDLDPPTTPLFFRLLLVYNRRTFTALRTYSSDTNTCSREAKRWSGPKIASYKLCALGQGVVLRGVAYWSPGRELLAVRLDAPEPSELCMPPTGIVALPLGWCTLSVAPDGRLMFIRAAVFEDDLAFARIVEDDMSTGKWKFIRPIRLRHNSRYVVKDLT